MRIGIDIGGMSIKLGLVDEKYQIVARKVIDTDADRLTPEEVIENTAMAAEKLLTDAGIRAEECEGIGVACPGTSDPKTGMVLYSNNIQWENVPLLAILKRHFAVPLTLANDADAAALGEVLNGAAKGKENAILLTLGTGVGGVILNRRIFAGSLRGGCELGHMVIQKNGKLCTCGRRGCLESYASAAALMELGREMAEQDPESLLNKLCQGDRTQINGKIIFEAEKAGDRAAGRVVEDYEESLSIGIANLVNIFRPEVVILGGGVSAQKEYLTDALQKRVDAMCFGGSLGEIPPIVTSKLLNDAGIIGAAYL